MDTRRNQDYKHWINHRHYRTYEIALRITRAVGSSADLRDLEFLHEGIIEFLSPWQKETAVHRFAHVVADKMFVDDTDGPYIQVQGLQDDGTVKSQRYLPVDVAMRSYDIDSREMFAVPEPDGTHIREGNVTRWQESTKVADACYEYVIDLQQTAPYGRLLTRLTDEVFHTIFPNRTLLGHLHNTLAIYVSQQGLEAFIEEPELAQMFAKDGRLKRISPPTWAKRAVFFRDHGHCVTCGTNLTGLIDALPNAQFDHIVPLYLGGLNDVSNLQLLCQPCNRQKSSALAQPSTRHRRYYERPEGE